MRAMYDEGMDAVLHPEKVFKNIKFDNVKDLVCGMPVSPGMLDTAHYNGKVFGFCSRVCKNEFLKNPGSYTLKASVGF